jgi:E3 ubiquitin-protein ligase RNF31
LEKIKFKFPNYLRIYYIYKEAEQCGFTAEDIQVSLNHCGEANPVIWLKENWDNMIDTVMTLASNVGHEKDQNTIGTLSKSEAREALRTHKGNIWASVTECVEQRQARVEHYLTYYT